MKPIRAILTRHDEGVFNLTEKINDIGQKNVGKIQSTLPTEPECKLAFDNTSCDARGDNLATDKLKNLKNQINSVRRPVNSNLKALNNLRKQIKKLRKKLKKLEDILEIINKLLPVLKIAAEALPLILITQQCNFGAGAIQGVTVVAVHSKIEAIKAKLSEIIASIKTYLEEIPPKYDELKNLKSNIEKGITALNEIKIRANELIKLLELSYLQYLQNCALGTGIGNDNLITDNTDSNFGPPPGGNNQASNFSLDITDLLGELEAANKQEVIVKIFNARLETIGYKRYKA